MRLKEANFMATKFYFQSIEINNFRAFKHLRLDDLKRINLIGGLNATGKTALLETLFFLLDKKNPGNLARIFQWRQSLGLVDVSIFFPNRQNNASIHHVHSKGKSRTLISETSVPAELTALYAGLNSGNVTNEVPRGFLVETFVDENSSQPDDVSFIRFTQQAAEGNTVRLGKDIGPQARFFSPALITPAHELADAVSTIIQKRNIKTLLEYIKPVNPFVKQLSVLSVSGASNVYATLEDDSMLPIQMLGGGFHGLVSIISQLLAHRDGVIFLDEMDACFHHSAVPMIWQNIAKIANEQNCQVFAVSHSEEAILSAASGIKNCNRSEDFQYLRLERNVDEHVVVHYSADELLTSIRNRIDVRGVQ
jgi:hypothetical protein